MKICKECDYPLHYGWLFCANCGEMTPRPKVIKGKRWCPKCATGRRNSIPVPTNGNTMSKNVTQHFCTVCGTKTTKI